MIDISSQRLVRIAAIGVVMATLGLSACGRKGPLDPPPGAAAPGQTSLQPAPAPGEPAPGGAAPAFAGVGPNGKAVAPPPSGNRQPFILDWLVE